MDSVVIDNNLVHPIMAIQNVILPPCNVDDMIECHLNRQSTRQSKIQKDASRNIQYMSANKSTYLVIVEVLEMQSSKQTELSMWLLQTSLLLNIVSRQSILKWWWLCGA